MKYYEELIERICRVIEERLYVCVETTETVEGYELIVTSELDDNLTKTYKVHYRDLEMDDDACNYDSPVLRIAENIILQFTSDYKDSMYRPN